MLRQNVDEMMSLVRAQLEEQSNSNVSDEDILQLLNMGQRKTTNVFSRKFNSVFLESETITTTAGETQPLPPGASGARVVSLELQRGNVFFKINKIQTSEAHRYRVTVPSAFPRWYSQEKNQITLYPAPSSGCLVKVWFFADPERLVLSSGIITEIADASNITVSGLTGITTDTSNPTAGGYVNIVDRDTGEVKASFEVASFDQESGSVRFSTTPSRPSVLGKTIAGAITDAMLIEPDDEICLISGTCIPEIPAVFVDYVTQTAICALKRRLGEPVADDNEALSALEEEIKKVWAGREAMLKVRRKTRWSNRW